MSFLSPSSMRYNISATSSILSPGYAKDPRSASIAPGLSFEELGSPSSKFPSRARMQSEFGGQQMPNTFNILSEVQQCLYRMAFRERGESSDKLQEEFKKSSELVRQLGHEISKRDTINSSLQIENDKLRAQLSELERELGKLRSVDADRLALNNENSKLRRENLSLKTEVKNTVISTQQEQDRLFHQYQKESKDAHTDASKAINKIQELEVLVNELRHRCAHAEGRVLQLEQTKQGNEVAIASLQAQRDQSMKAEEGAKEQIENLKIMQAQQEVKYRDLKFLAKDLEERVRFSSLMQSELHDTKSREVQAHGKIVLLEKEASELKERVIRAEEAAIITELKSRITQNARSPEGLNSSFSKNNPHAASYLSPNRSIALLQISHMEANNSNSTTSIPSSGIITEIEPLWKEGRRLLDTSPKEWMRAQRVFSRICEMAKHDFLAHLFAGACYTYAVVPEPKIAELYIRTALSLNRGSMSANALLTRCLVQQHRYSDALQVGKMLLNCKEEKEDQLRLVADGLKAMREASCFISSASTPSSDANLNTSFHL